MYMAGIMQRRDKVFKRRKKAKTTFEHMLPCSTVEGKFFQGEFCSILEYFPLNLFINSFAQIKALARLLT